MGRPKLRITIDEATRHEVEELYRTTTKVGDKERLLAVRLASGGDHSFTEIAATVGRPRSLIQKWMDRFGEGGVAGLLERGKAPGKSSPLATDKIQTALLEGLREGRWRTAGQISAWLKAEHGIERKPKRIYYWLGKCAGALKVPRPAHTKKESTATEAFKHDLAERIASLGLPAGEPVKIWVLDEARYGLHSITRRCWGLRGVRVVIPRQQKFQWGYLYGAVEVMGGGAEFLLMPTVNLDCHKIFLEQLAASDPAAHHVVIQDQAGFHYHTDDPRPLPGRIHIVSLPPYSPELNPVEKLWDQLKDVLCNRAFPTLPEIEEVIENWSRAMSKNADGLRSLIGLGWLHSQTNAS